MSSKCGRVLLWTKTLAVPKMPHLPFSITHAIYLRSHNTYCVTSRQKKNKQHRLAIPKQNDFPSWNRLLELHFGWCWILHLWLIVPLQTSRSTDWMTDFVHLSQQFFFFKVNFLPTIFICSNPFQVTRIEKLALVSQETLQNIICFITWNFHRTRPCVLFLKLRKMQEIIYQRELKTNRPASTTSITWIMFLKPYQHVRNGESVS